MRVYLKIEKLMDLILKAVLKFFIFIHEVKNILVKRDLYSKVELSDEQIQQIDDIWLRSYGKTYSKKWHRLYQSYTGSFDPRYFPEILFSTKLEPKLNPRHVCRTLTDKTLIELLLNSDYIRHPQSKLINANGYFYDGTREVIDKEKAINIINNIGNIVIKPTVNSSSGRGVRLLNIRNGIDENTGQTVESILKEYKKNFIFQENISPHFSYKNLHEYSVNTLRVITYIVDGEVHSTPLSLRIGMNKSFVDNAHAGGMVIGVSDNGVLREEAYTEYQKKYKVHPDSGIEFNGYEIIKTREIIEAAKKLHGRLPNLGIISWDFTVDENEEIVLIEVNLNSQTIWFPQFSNGKSIFGEHTEYMLKLIS